MATISGDNGDNTLSDTADGDFVDAQGGNDTVTITHASSADGGAGNDGITVDLSATNTAINWNLLLNTYAGPQSFTNFEYFNNLKTGSGNDTIVTSNNPAYFSDTIAAGAGDDTITSYGGDTIDGGTGFDTLIIDDSNPPSGIGATRPYNPFTLSTDGGGGIDGYYYGVVAFSSIEKFIIYGSNSGDTWVTYNGDDTIIGGSAADTIYAGAGVNTVDGGAGIDGISADLSSATAPIVWNLQANTYSGPGSYTNLEYFGNNIDNATANLPSSSRGGLYTGSGDDVITTAFLSIQRQSRVDTGAGNDTLKQYNGQMTWTAGAGNDTLILDYSAATVAVATGGSTSSGTANVAPTADGIGGYDGSYHFNAVTGVVRGLVSFTSVERFDITTGSGNDLITTGGGDDIIHTGLGNDSITALGGNDLLYPGVGTDIVNGGAGTDRLILDYSTATTAITTIAAPTANGTTGGFDGHYGDGTAAFDVTYTSVEAFTITTGSGNDVIVTASGDDIIDGGAGADTMTGGAGNDIYYVDDSGDVVVENNGEGTDEIRTALASYTLANNSNGDRAVENLTGLSSAGQTLIGNTLDNVIVGGSGNDTLNGAGGNDSVYGNAGNDTLSGGPGNDTLYGGTGDDMYVAVNTTDTIVELAGEGTDTIEISSALTFFSMANIANVENLRAPQPFSNGVTLIGNALDNDISTTTSPFPMNPGDNLGNDRIDGGAGNDTMTGGVGNDTYVVDSLGDVVIENADEGTDTIETTLASYTLASANVENLTGTATTGQELTGDANANVITGGSGDDTLDGGGGADTLVGGPGNDTYIVDTTGVTIVESQNQGNDTVVTTLAAYTLAANLETLTYAGTGTFTGTGNDDDNTIDASATSAGATLYGGGGDDILIGGAGDDTLDGGGGADTLTGGAGNDTYVVNALGATIVEQANGGTDTISTSLASYTLATANVENLTGTATTGQTLTGDANANTITGGTGNDTLDGGGGTDRLVGGLGDDTYIVDSLDDVVVENTGEGFDVVRTSTASYVLPANVEQLVYTGTGAANLSGNAGDNMLTGNTGNDYFDASQGGNDTLNGGGGNDGFYFGAAFTGDDRVDGGAGTNDQIGLRGDYTGANRVVLQAATITGVELIAAIAGFSYDITTVDANLATGQTLGIYGSGLGSGDALTFDGTAESTGAFMVYGGRGADNIKTGGGNDGIYFGEGRFNVATDHVDGGGGTNDQMALDGTYTGLTIARANVVNIETLALLDGQPTAANYSITLANDWTQTGEVHTVYAVGVRNGVTVDGAAETDAMLRFYGGSGADTLTGGSFGNWFDGGAGGDTMTGGAGVDTFSYSTAASSMGVNHDRIVDFNASQDKITLPFGVNGIDTATSGALSTGTFDTDLTNALATLGAHHAVQFTAQGGDLNGHIFEVIDANGVAGYQAGQDMVIELVTPTGGPITTPTPFL